MLVSATIQQHTPSTSKIAVYCQWLLRDGYKEQTIQSHSKGLRFLARNTDLADPESVRIFLASRKCSSGRKQNLVDIYAKYAKYSSIAFSEPRYAREDKLPFVPLQKELEAIMDASRNVREATFLRLLYETGMRVGEATRLQFKEFDFEKRTVRVVPEKGSNARELKLSDRLCSMLKDLFKTKPDRPFPTFSGARKYLETTRKILAKSQNNPRFLLIHLHTFRHFRATMLYAQTRDILHVRHILGHKSLMNTMRYTHLIEYEGSSHYLCKVAKTPDEAIKLVENGFDYVTSFPEGIQLYRKRA
jgi:integrase